MMIIEMKLYLPLYWQYRQKLKSFIGHTTFTDTGLNTKLVAIIVVVTIGLVIGSVLMAQSVQPITTPKNTSSAIESNIPQDPISVPALVTCDQARNAGQMTLDCNNRVSRAVVNCANGSASSICSDPRLDAYSTFMSHSAISRIVSLGIDNSTYYSGWIDYSSSNGYDILHPPGWKIKDSGSILNIIPPEGRGYVRIIQAPLNESIATQYLTDLRSAILGGVTTGDAKIIQNITTVSDGQYHILGAIYAVNASGLQRLAAAWTADVDDGSSAREYGIVFTGPHEIFLKYFVLASNMVRTFRFDQDLAGNDGSVQQVKGNNSSQCMSNNGLPDPRCTFGETDPAVTQYNIRSTICVLGYTEKVTPPTSISDPMKYASMKAYGYTDSPGNYEYDHLIPLELGGTSTVNNLWPEPYSGADSAYAKDSVESALRNEVCSGQITLADAQQEIAKNWTAVYAHLHGQLPVNRNTSSACPGYTIPIGNGRCLDPGNYLG